MSKTRRATPALSPEEAATVHMLIETRGMARTVDELAISQQTAAKIAARLPVSRAIVTHVRSRLQALETAC